ncbi:hypothetical protein Cni_G02162 [Canna indica]|uniref:Uncharacterized protein n=1 Tax=Canna indica TaxID=4628 RepID=A0AAQ3JQS1_9LILI|nr:hypothetical protein Cni_G02162 [Canna indica]
MNFIFIMPGWEGSASDSRILRDALNRRNGLKVLIGNYYLVDAGYTNGEEFLAPYRSTRYHLSEWGEGFGWDSERKCVTAEKGVWEEYLKKDADARILKNKPFPYYEKLSVIFGKDRATGVNVQTPVDVIERLDEEDDQVSHLFSKVLRGGGAEELLTRVMATRMATRKRRVRDAAEEDLQQPTRRRMVAEEAVTDDEVEEFFAILQRMQEASRHFAVRDGKAKAPDALRPWAASRWRPAFEREDFEEVSAVEDNGRRRTRSMTRAAESSARGERTTDHSVEEEAVAENRSQMRLLDLNAEPASEE